MPADGGVSTRESDPRDVTPSRALARPRPSPCHCRGKRSTGPVFGRPVGGAFRMERRRRRAEPRHPRVFDVRATLSDEKDGGLLHLERRGRAMFEIGSTLREARERQAFELADVERATKIRLRYLAALEEERFERLPGGAYAKGFLRSYAEFLGLEGQLFVDEYA